MQGGRARRKSLLRRNAGVERDDSIILRARGRERVRVAVVRASVIRFVGMAEERAVGDWVWYLICTGEVEDDLVDLDEASGMGFVA